MDISSGSSYPASSLSNFAPHPFIIDDIECASMEGFLQSLKFKDENIQREICKKVGRQTKRAGAKKNWQKEQTLYWRGKPYKRDSIEYQKLLDRAFFELSKNSSFKKALLATKNANLTHSIGKKKSSETVLTKKEFIGRLMKIREKLLKENERKL